jgi:toxin ParE1/3/4
VSGGYVLTPRALADMDEIADRISRDSLTNAMTWTARMERMFELIASMPGIGTAREELSPGVRSVPEGNYLIFFRAHHGVVQILRVLQGYRNITSWFFK